MASNGKILVVDDNVSLVRMLEGVLLRNDFEVIVAYDGEEALAKVKVQPPDLIVLDIVMPRLNGYEVCRRLHEDPATAVIPVILLTVKGQVDDPELDASELEVRIAEQMAGYEVGAVDFIPKPIKALELLERIKSHLDIDREAASRSG
ncbi:MAG: response regulator [Thermoflexales bacterium]|nr:response regulator [Thermoflexales bacterium]